MYSFVHLFLFSFRHISDLLNNGDYYGNRAVFSPCSEGQFDVQRMDGLHHNGNFISSDSAYNAGLLRDHTNQNYMKMGQHTTLHHSPLPSAAQEAQIFGGNAYSYPTSNNLHMNTVSSMW